MRVVYNIVQTKISDPTILNGNVSKKQHDIKETRINSQLSKLNCKSKPKTENPNIDGP